jgi:hypothetical protein
LRRSSPTSHRQRLLRDATGTDTNNYQPRLGATWDSRGNGPLIVRGGWGVYVTRNRPWIQIRSMNQFASSAVRIEDRTRLRNFPDTAAVLGGRTLDEYPAAFGGRNLGTVIPDDFVQPYALNTTVGAGWQVNPTTTLNVDTTMRGTQRTPHGRGYNPSDQRHNLTVAGAVELPWAIQVSGILKLISGSPTKVQTGGRSGSTPIAPRAASRRSTARF